MSWADIKEYMDYLRTDNVMEQLQTWNVGDLATNPWFLGGFALIVLILYFLGMRAIAGFMVGIGGFSIVLSLAVAQGSGTKGLEGSGLWILVGGGAAAVMLFIYLLFIKSD